MELLKVELVLGIFQPQFPQQFGDINIVRVDNKPQTSHDGLELVLYHLCVFQVLVKVAIENLMTENFLPRSSVFLLTS